MALELKKRPKGEAKAAAPANPDFVPAFPTVNVLPGNVLEVVAVANLKKKIIAGAVAAVLALTGIWLAQATNIALANRGLKAEQAKTAGLNKEATGLAPVQTYYTGVEGNATLLRQTLAKDILNSNIVLGLFQQATKAQTTLLSVNMTVDTTAAAPGMAAAPSAIGAACPGPDPFNAKASIGCITLSGKAASRQAVGNYINALTDTALFVNPYVSTTSADAETGAVVFSATVGVVDKAYSKRYAADKFLKGVGQ